jgi:uncharacterized damage-inducible protein DinB
MIDARYCRLMAAYNSEMNRRLYGAADRLTDAARREDEGAFFGSIHRTLSHLLWGDKVWMHRFDAWPPPPGLLRASPDAFPDWDALKALRTETDAAIEAWAARVTDAFLAGTLSWHSAVAGRDVSRPTWMLVAHMFNHQTHHRGQAHALITRAGGDTGDTDVPFVVDPAVAA